MGPSHLSQQAYDRLQEELADPSGPRRKEISAWIERAREHGDIRENADYDAAKNEQGHNEARVGQLESILCTPVMVGDAAGAVAGPRRGTSWHPASSSRSRWTATTSRSSTSSGRSRSATRPTKSCRCRRRSGRRS